MSGGDDCLCDGGSTTLSDISTTQGGGYRVDLEIDLEA